MCRLFGFRSSVPSRAHRSLLEAENALAVQASQHSDGWGIGYFLGQEGYVLKAESGAATDERFARITRALTSNAMVVHVRRATVGDVDYLNSHPFRHGAWMFAHNGTIFGFERLREQVLAATRPHLRDLVFGSTDSEHLFYYLVSALAGAGVPDHGRDQVAAPAAMAALETAIAQLYDWAAAAGLDPPILNFILTNGRVFFAQRAGLELYLASQKISCADFGTCPEPDKVCMDVVRPLSLALRRKRTDRPVRRVNHTLVASEPIGQEDIWEEIPEGALICVDEEFQLWCRPPTASFVKCPSPPAPAPRPRPERVAW